MAARRRLLHQLRLYRQQMQTWMATIMPQPNGLDVHDTTPSSRISATTRWTRWKSRYPSQGDDRRTQDPYAAFAQQTLTELNSPTANGVVTNRRGFQSMVRLWRFNQDVLKARPESPASGASGWRSGARSAQAQLSVLNRPGLHEREGDGGSSARPCGREPEALVASLAQRPESAATGAGAQDASSASGTTTRLVRSSGRWCSTPWTPFSAAGALDEGVEAEDPTIRDALFRILSGSRWWLPVRWQGGLGFSG